MKTNANLSDAELDRLRGERLNARTMRKFYNRRRYERQYARRMPERMIPLRSVCEVRFTFVEAPCRPY